MRITKRRSESSRGCIMRRTKKQTNIAHDNFDCLHQFADLEKLEQFIVSSILIDLKSWLFK